MNFRVDPFDVIRCLHSLVEQKESRITFIQAVQLLASKGLVLPGKNKKEQAQVLASLVNLCDSNFLNVRPGKGGGVGLPSFVPATKRAGRARSASSEAAAEATETTSSRNA